MHHSLTVPFYKGIPFTYKLYKDKIIDKNNRLYILSLYLHKYDGTYIHMSIIYCGQLTGTGKAKVSQNDISFVFSCCFCRKV